MLPTAITSVRVAAQQQLEVLAQRRVVLDDQDALDLLLQALLEPADRLQQLLARGRLEHVADRAELERGRWRSCADIMCTGMWRVAGSRLRRSSTERPE